MSEAELNAVRAKSGGSALSQVWQRLALFSCGLGRLRTRIASLCMHVARMHACASSARMWDRAVIGR
jgi:hypothetical protein